VSAKFEFIGAQKAHYPITKMCEWAQVSTSGFYEWRDRPTSATARRRVHLGRLIEAIFDDSDRTYGHRRIHAALARQGEHCSPEVVRGLMRELDLVACQPRPWRPTTTLTGDTGAIPDLLNRDFTADVPGRQARRRHHLFGSARGYVQSVVVSGHAGLPELAVVSTARRCRCT